MIGINCFYKKTKEGFTLIEMIVAIAIFSVVMISVAGVLLSSFKAQRKSFALQNAQSNARYLMEYMVREIRMSKINTGEGETDTLNITNSKGETIDYKFDLPGAFGRPAELLRGGVLLIPENIDIIGKFYVKSDDAQPRVTIVMKVKSKGGKPEEQAEINLQNTVSSRSY